MGDDDQEAVSSSPRDTTGTRCKHCGTAIDTSDWYPVTTDRASDGTLQLHSFCSEACQEEWLTERQA